MTFFKTSLFGIKDTQQEIFCYFSFSHVLRGVIKGCKFFFGKVMKLPKIFQPPQSEYEIFKVGKAELNFSGCYITDYKTWWKYIRGVVNVSALGLSALSEYAMAVQLLGEQDLPNLFDVLCPSTTMMVTTFKLYVMLWKQREMQELFKLFERTFAKGKSSSLRIHLVLRHMILLTFA